MTIVTLASWDEPVYPPWKQGVVPAIILEGRVGWNLRKWCGDWRRCDPATSLGDIERLVPPDYDDDWGGWQYIRQFVAMSTRISGNSGLRFIGCQGFGACTNLWEEVHEDWDYVERDGILWQQLKGLALLCHECHQGAHDFRWHSELEVRTDWDQIARTVLSYARRVRTHRNEYNYRRFMHAVIRLTVEPNLAAAFTRHIDWDERGYILKRKRPARPKPAGRSRSRKG